MKTVNLISVPVTNQAVSKEFYIKMGLKLMSEIAMGENQKWIQLSFPEGDISITLVTWFPKMPPGSLQGITILTDNIELEIKRLNESGIKTGEIEFQEWGKFSNINDPDGNTWILHEKNSI